MLTLIQKLAHLCLKPLIALFDFPVVPAELTTLVNKLFEYIQAGTGILNFFVPFDVIRPAIDVFLANDDNDGVFRSQRTGSKSMGVNICGARSRSQQNRR